MANIPQQNTGGIGDITSLLSLFKSSGQTTTSSETVDPAKASALLQQILQGNGGLAAVSMGGKSAGLYNSTTNQQLTNDLLARATGQVAALSSTKTTTQQTNPPLNLATTALTAAGTLGAKSLLGPSATALSSKLGLSDMGTKLKSALGLDGSAPAATSTTADLSNSVLGVDAGAPDAASAASLLDVGTESAADLSGSILGADAAGSAGMDLLGSAGLEEAGAEFGGDTLLATAAETAGEDALGDAALAALVAWIICSELVKQGRLPVRYYRKGGAKFASYSDTIKRGYYVWAIPSVIHLRNKPHSTYSKFLEVIFNIRAEWIATGNKKLLGSIIEGVLYPTCYILGKLCSHRNFMEVYKDTVTAK